jgi:predicted GNAT superfamily acetyltransferase
MDRRKQGKPKIPSAAIVVRHCHGLAEFGACFEIQRAVWGSADADLVPMPLFVVAAETGGQVLGAFADDRMVGFTLALAGLHGKDKSSAPSSPDRPRRAGRGHRRLKPFLHSHMTAVMDGWRDRGIGRSLKLFQRNDALARGIDLIEWTFDPLQVKNAYFNLVRLGAIARRFVPNMYGTFSSPLQGGLPTDRLIAEWHLGSARVRRAVADRPEGKRGAPAARGRARGAKLVRIRVPAELAAARNMRPDEALCMQAEIRQEFEYWLNRGYAATSIKVAGQGGQYLLEPWGED